MKVVMIEDLPQKMLSMVEDHKLDTALVAQNNFSGGLDFTALWHEPLYLGMRAGHPLCNWSTIRPEEVPAQDFIRLPHAFGFDLEQHLPAADNTLRASKAFDLSALRFETVCRHVCHSEDCTLVPALAAAQFKRDGWPMDFVPLGGPGHLRNLGAVTRPHCPRKSLLDAISGYIQQTPPEGVTPTKPATPST